MARYPLEGYRVVDFGSAWAGPMTTHLLADMGAEVIKVESHVRIDFIRYGGQQFPALVKEEASEWKEIELSPSFHCMNRGKLGITVDFTKPQGAALMRELITLSDVATDNFTPGVLDRYGLGYQSLAAIKPDIIVASLCFAGHTGPLKETRGYAPVITALGGTDSLVGYLDESIPGGMRFAYGDTVAAMHGAVAILAALIHRNRTGEGQYVDISEWETTTTLIGEALLDYIMNGRIQGPQGNRHPRMAPHGFYPCNGEDKWVSIAVKTEEEWHNLCHALGNPPWTEEERFRDMYNRLLNQDALDKLIAEWTANYDHYQVTELLQRAGVAAAPALISAEQYHDPHYRQRQTYVEVEHAIVGTETFHTAPWKLGETPGGIRRSGPMLGEHNEYVFSELLGMPPEDLNQLMEERIIY